MSVERVASEHVLSVGQGVTETVEWLRSYGITRVTVLPPVFGGRAALMWQETYRSPVEVAFPGDVLRAVDLGGTSGELAVINSGPGRRLS